MITFTSQGNHFAQQHAFSTDFVFSFVKINKYIIQMRSAILLTILLATLVAVSYASERKLGDLRSRELCSLVSEDNELLNFLCSINRSGAKLKQLCFLQILFPSLRDKLQPLCELLDSELEITDYLVIGGGPAGSVLASRLADDYDKPNVLLVEAGKKLEDLSDPNAVNDANRFLEAPDLPELDYNFTTTPQAGVYGRVISLSRAQVVGGCDSHNGLVYRMGVPELVDAWNVPGWNWEDLQEAFEETRDKVDVVFSPENAWTAEQTELKNTILANSGLPVLSDVEVYGPSKVGIQRILHNIKVTDDNFWLRYSSYIAYVEESPRLGKNLNVLTEVRIDKLIFVAKIAIGAKGTRLSDGKKVFILFKREVIVTAGAYNTPHLLLRSGIGNETEINAAGLHFVASNPEVGHNLLTQWALVQIRTVAPGRFVNESSRSYTTGLSVLANLSSSYPDAIYDMWQIDNPRLAYAGLPTKVFFNVMYNSDTFSPGVVKYDPSDPAKPIINPKIFAPADMQHMIRMFKAGRSYTAGSTLYPVEIVPPPVDGNGNPIDWNNDATAEAFIKGSVSDGSHPIGTTRMGTDANSVVDPYLRVRGVHRVRVADVSVAPAHIGAGTKPLAMAIGYHAADLILNY